MPTYYSLTCHNSNCNKQFNVLPINKHRKYCNSSCAAIQNNKNRSKESRLRQQKSIISFHIKNKKTHIKNKKIHIKNKKIHKTLKNNTKLNKNIEGNLFPKRKHAVVKFCKLVLNKNTDITVDDFQNVKNQLLRLLQQGYSPTGIKKLFHIEYTNFGMFLKKGFGIKLKTLIEASHNYQLKSGRRITDEKKIYYKKCKFKFDPYSIPEIPGYNLLLSFGFFHATKNPNGVCRDHIISISYGWRYKIDPTLISHPANCQFISNTDNILKGSSSSMTIDELILRINSNSYTRIENKFIKLPKSEETKNKIRETNKKFMIITNGTINLRILKTSEIPSGFRRGYTRKYKNGA